MLTTREIDEFVTQGHLVIRRAFSLEVAEECRRSAARQLGIDLANSDTWEYPVVRGVPTGRPFEAAANAARLLEAIAQLVGPDVWLPRPNLGAFVVRFPSAADPGDTGWHIDASFQPPGDRRWFVNYRSKQRALLLLCLVSDVGPDDAPTRLLPESHLEMARLLAPAGEKGLPAAHAGQESEIPIPPSRSGEIAATGSAGDVFVCHPFLVHAAGWPHRGHQPRFVAQPPMALAGELELEGPFDQISPVARAIRLGLGETFPPGPLLGYPVVDRADPQSPVVS